MPICSRAENFADVHHLSRLHKNMSRKISVRVAAFFFRVIKSFTPTFYDRQKAYYHHDNTVINF